MNRDDIIARAEEFVGGAPGNYISEEAALSPGCAGMRIYDAPIFAFGSADDGIFMKFKNPDVVGRHFMGPVEWLSGAKTVISFFLPFSSAVKAANALDCRWPADEWLHGRYEGQQLLSQLLKYLEKILSEAGFKSLAPSADRRFRTGGAEENVRFTSNWSERHVAYACGLGTFGLSRGIITGKGMCGRLGSVLTELDLPKDLRNYDGVYDYCAMCGACIGRCPSRAISIEGAMEHSLCSDFLDRTRAKHSPRYGCGKCQVNVPCESGIPAR